MTDSRIIPQADPRAGYLAHKEEIDAAVARVLDSGGYILGEHVATFERHFAAYVGAPHAVGVASGTDAVELALRAFNIGLGDCVFTTSHTAVATVAAIARCGATAVLVDIDPAHYTIDPNQLEESVRAVQTGRLGGAREPKAIIPVHLYGQQADMPAIMDIAARHNLAVVEDCAQAHGATLHGKKVGQWADLAAFSFYPTKNLGAFGDGGMVVAKNPAVAQRLREIREYGWRERYVSATQGVNSRLDPIQAAVLDVKLKYLDADNNRRREIAGRYHFALAMTGLGLPIERPGASHVYHLYVVRCKQRDRLREALHQQKIGTAIHYPVPVHQQPAYLALPTLPGGLTRTEEAARCILSLPMYPQLSDEQVDCVAAAIKSFSHSTTDKETVPAR